MSQVEMQKHLDVLKQYAAQPNTAVDEIVEVRVKKSQLRVIQRAIRHLEKTGVPVPGSLKSEKLELVAAIENLERSSGGCVHVYEQLLSVVATLGRACGRRPHHELYLQAKERRHQVTAPEVFRKTIIAVLKDLGGVAHQRDIMAKIAERLHDKFTEADLDRPNGKNMGWQQAVRRERKRMIKDGALTEDSQSTWKLVK